MHICEVPYDGSLGEYRRLYGALRAEGLPVTCPSCGEEFVVNDIFVECPNCEGVIAIGFVADSSPEERADKLHARMQALGGSLY